MSTEKDVRELVIVNELSQLLGKAFTIYNKTTGEAFGLDGQAVINIASAAVDKSQNIPLDSGSTTKVPVVAAVEGELNKKVSLSGNEAVAGVKTFSSSPIVPSPTAAQQAASKKYVDDSVATRQAALTFGIADANAVKINAPDVVAGDFARFTALGLQGRSASEVISDIGAESIANKNVAGGYAGLGLGGKVLPELLPDFVLGQVRYGGTFSSTGVIVSEYASLNGQNISSIAAADYFGYYFIALASITVHGYSFYVGDWLISNGSAGWGKVDNTDAVTTVAGRTGAITLTKSDITDFPNKWAWEDLSGVPVTFAPSSHTHEWADLTNPPASYTPSAHVHGNISNDGKIGTTADYVVVTGSGGTLTTASRAGIDSRSSFPPADHAHDNRYYTETEINNFFSGAIAIAGYNKTNWDTAYGWGNHASAGYASAATLSSHISDTSSHLSATDRTYFNKLKDYLKIAADNTSIYTTINFYSERGLSAFGLGDTGSGGGTSSVITVDHFNDISYDPNRALSAYAGARLNTALSQKQPLNSNLTSIAAINTDGLLRRASGNWVVDNTSYATISQLSGYALTSSLSNYLLKSGGYLTGSVHYSDSDTSSTMPSHFYHKLYSETSVYQHIFPAGYTYGNATNLFIRVSDGVSSYRTFGIKGDGNLEWNGAYVLTSSNFSSYTDGRYYTETESDARYAYKAGSTSQPFNASAITLNGTFDLELHPRLISSNLTRTLEGVFRPTAAHGSYGYSGIEFSWGSTRFFNYTGAVTTDTITPQLVFEINPYGQATFASTVSAFGGNSTQWNTAYGWGNHAGLYAARNNATISSAGATPLTLYTGANTVDNFINFTNDGQSVKFGVRNPYSTYGLTLVTPTNDYYRIIHAGNIGSQSVNYAASASSSTYLSTYLGAVNGGLQYWQASGNTTLNPDSSWWYALRMGHGDADTYYSATLAISFDADVIQFRRKKVGVDNAWQTLWHTGNDGSGSGLDADLLDGQHASYFATASQLNAANLSSGYLPYWNGGSLANTSLKLATDGFYIQRGSNSGYLDYSAATGLQLYTDGTPVFVGSGWNSHITLSTGASGYNIGEVRIPWGNVGIGYTGRSEKLAVNGSGYFNGNLTIGGLTPTSVTGAGDFTFYRAYAGAGSASYPGYSFPSSVQTGMFLSESNVLGFATAGVVRQTIDSTGAATFASNVTANGWLDIISTTNVLSIRGYQGGSVYGFVNPHIIIAHGSGNNPFGIGTNGTASFALIQGGVQRLLLDGNGVTALTTFKVKNGSFLLEASDGSVSGFSMSSTKGIEQINNWGVYLYGPLTVPTITATTSLVLNGHTLTIE